MQKFDQACDTGWFEIKHAHAQSFSSSGFLTTSVPPEFLSAFHACSEFKLDQASAQTSIINVAGLTRSNPNWPHSPFICRYYLKTWISHQLDDFLSLIYLKPCV